MKRTMVRIARDNYEAFQLCRAFEDVGGEPFSVVLEVSIGGYQRWHVFGRIEEGCETRVDDANGARIKNFR